MYLAYCLNPANATWTPPVHLNTPEECFDYCLLHHVWALEIRVTDEDDYVVLHVEAHVMKLPMPDGTLHEFELTV